MSMICDCDENSLFHRILKSRRPLSAQILYIGWQKKSLLSHPASWCANPTAWT